MGLGEATDQRCHQMPPGRPAPDHRQSPTACPAGRKPSRLVRTPACLRRLGAPPGPVHPRAPPTPDRGPRGPRPLSPQLTPACHVFGNTCCACPASATQPHTPPSGSPWFAGNSGTGHQEGAWEAAFTRQFWGPILHVLAPPEPPSSPRRWSPSRPPVYRWSRDQPMFPRRLSPQPLAGAGTQPQRRWEVNFKGCLPP